MEQLKNEKQQLKQLKESNTPSNAEKAERIHRPKIVHAIPKSRDQTKIIAEIKKL